jgi:uncharacterized protein YoxC
MVPTWVGVVMAVSLAIIALAALAVAAATASAAWGMRTAFKMLQGLAGPALEDVRSLVGTIRAEVEGLTGTSRELRARVVRAADAAAARLAELDALVGAVQEEVGGAALDVAATLRTLRRGTSLLDLGRRVVTGGGGGRKRRGRGRERGKD